MRSELMLDELMDCIHVLLLC